MGDLPKELFIKNKQQKDLFNRLYNMIKDEAWTDTLKEQWPISMVSELETDEEFRKINKLLDMGLKSERVDSKILYLSFKRRIPKYFMHNPNAESDFWDINKG